MTNVAKILKVHRSTIQDWARNDADFDNAIQESRKQMLDTFVDTARIMALGKMILNDKKEFVGWEITPDSQMLRYFISTLGRDEGYGEQVTLHHTADEGVDVARWIEREIEEKKKLAETKEKSE